MCLDQLHIILLYDLMSGLVLDFLQVKLKHMPPKEIKVDNRVPYRDSRSKEAIVDEMCKFVSSAYSK